MCHHDEVQSARARLVVGGSCHIEECRMLVWLQNVPRSRRPSPGNHILAKKAVIMANVSTVAEASSQIEK